MNPHFPSPTPSYTYKMGQAPLLSSTTLRSAMHDEMIAMQFKDYAKTEDVEQVWAMLHLYITLLAGCKTCSQSTFICRIVRQIACLYTRGRGFC